MNPPETGTVSPDRVQVHSALETLDDDILRLIIDLFSYPQSNSPQLAWTARSTQTLLALTLTSKRLHAITLPILYQTFIEPPSKNPVSSPCLATYLGTLLLHPHISHYTTRYLCISSQTTKVDISRLTPSDWTRINAITKICARTLGYSHTMWLESMWAGEWDVFVAFLLFLLPNVRELVVLNWREDTIESSRKIMRLVRMAGQFVLMEPEEQNLPLGKLRSVKFSDGEIVGAKKARKGIVDLETLFPFLELPSLHQFTFSSTPIIWQTIFSSDTNEPEESEYRFKYITCLRITKSVIPHDSLPFFLRMFPNLEELEYIQDERTRAGFNPSAFYEGITHLKGSLKRLKVDCHCRPFLRKGIPKQICVIGPFTDFSALKHLDISAQLAQEVDDGDGLDEEDWEEEEEEDEEDEDELIDEDGAYGSDSDE